jgi:broad specificity phosphatase PhoE
MTAWDRIAADGQVALVLFRHGRTAWNAERRFLGATDLALDEAGVAEVGRLSHLRSVFDAIYSSPLARARQTAEALAPPPILLVDALRELHQGALEGMTGPEAMAQFPEFFAGFAGDPTDLRVPEGESLGEVRDRALGAVRRIAAERSPGDRVAVVTHQMVIASLVCTLSGEALTAWRRFGVPNTGTVVLAWDGVDLHVR